MSTRPVANGGPLLEAIDLHKRFAVSRGWGRGRHLVRAVDGVSLAVAPREWLGLVGESGSGKSTLARLLVRLVDADAGGLRSEGRDVLAMRGSELRAWRRRVQIVFQDASGSLNPRQKIGAALAEVLHVHRLASGAAAVARVEALLARVGLDPVQRARYPHELSGGQRQRVGIARALAVEPAMLVCDEPVSALDVSVQAQILNLLRDLQAALGLAGILISHDLRVVRQICDRVAVLYMGRIVEEGPAERIYESPLHPYTRALLEAVPDPRAAGARAVRGGATAGAATTRSGAGCAYRARCPAAEPRCATEDPLLLPAEPGHRVACHIVPGRSTAASIGSRPIQ